MECEDGFWLVVTVVVGVAVASTTAEGISAPVSRRRKRNEEKMESTNGGRSTLEEKQEKEEEVEGTWL